MQKTQMVSVAVSPLELSKIDTEALLQHRTGFFRPTAVALVRNGDGDVLLVKSVKNRLWGFPQGGVHRCESVVDGLLRELKEETGIVPTAICKLCHTDALEIPGHNNGFTRGKQYYYFLVKCEGTPEVLLQPQEVSEYRWRSPRSAAVVIASLGERYREKRKSMLTALQNAF